MSSFRHQMLNLSDTQRTTQRWQSVRRSTGRRLSVKRGGDSLSIQNWTKFRRCYHEYLTAVKKVNVFLISKCCCKASLISWRKPLPFRSTSFPIRSLNVTLTFDAIVPEILALSLKKAPINNRIYFRMKFLNVCVCHKKYRSLYWIITLEYACQQANRTPSSVPTCFSRKIILSKNITLRNFAVCSPVVQTNTSKLNFSEMCSFKLLCVLVFSGKYLQMKTWYSQVWQTWFHVYYLQVWFPID